MKNVMLEDAAKHIVDVFRDKLNEQLNYGEVLNKFEHLISNDELYTLNENYINKFFSKTITDKEVIEFSVNSLYGKLNEGFYNPFDDDNFIGNEDSYIKDIRVPDGVEVKDMDGCPIKSIKKWDSNVNGKIYCRGKGKMFSGVRFIPGDIIEECPIVILKSDGMFSRDVRDLAFQVYPDKEVYGIPYGYANCYATDEDSGDEPNIDYEYKPEEGIIRFYAISNIKPNNCLILRTGYNFIS